MEKPTIEWSARAKTDVKNIFSHLLKTNSVTVAQKIINEIATAPETITFSEQYQFDEYITNCRRIIVRNYKILYQEQQGKVAVVSVFNSRNNPLKMTP